MSHKFSIHSIVPFFFAFKINDGKRDLFLVQIFHCRVQKKTKIESKSFFFWWIIWTFRNFFHSLILFYLMNGIPILFLWTNQTQTQKKKKKNKNPWISILQMISGLNRKWCVCVCVQIVCSTIVLLIDNWNFFSSSSLFNSKYIKHFCFSSFHFICWNDI